MGRQTCPGQDDRRLRAEEVAEVQCPECGATVELWPDEPAHACPECSRQVANPKLDLACLEWCEHADECLKKLRSGDALAEDLREAAAEHEHDNDT